MPGLPDWCCTPGSRVPTNCTCCGISSTATRTRWDRSSDAARRGGPVRQRGVEQTLVHVLGERSGPNRLRDLSFVTQPAANLRVEVVRPGHGQPEGAVR